MGDSDMFTYQNELRAFLLIKNTQYISEKYYKKPNCY